MDETNLDRVLCAAHSDTVSAKCVEDDGLLTLHISLSNNANAKFALPFWQSVATLFVLHGTAAIVCHGDACDGRSMVAVVRDQRLQTFATPERILRIGTIGAQSLCTIHSHQVRVYDLAHLDAPRGVITIDAVQVEAASCGDKVLFFVIRDTLNCVHCMQMDDNGMVTCARCVARHAHSLAVNPTLFSTYLLVFEGHFAVLMYDHRGMWLSNPVPFEREVSWCEETGEVLVVDGSRMSTASVLFD